MTSMPASRSARAMIFAPRSWPSRPGLATTTRIFRLAGSGMPAADCMARRAHDAERHLHAGVDRAHDHVATAARHPAGERALRLRAGVETDGPVGDRHVVALVAAPDPADGRALMDGDGRGR